MHPEWELRPNFPGPFMPLDHLAQDSPLHPPPQTFLPLGPVVQPQHPGLASSGGQSGAGPASLSGLPWLCSLLLGMRLLSTKAFLCNHMAPVLHHLQSSYVSQDWGKGFVNMNSFHPWANPMRWICHYSHLPMRELRLRGFN